MAEEKTQTLKELEESLSKQYEELSSRLKEREDKSVLFNNVILAKQETEALEKIKARLMSLKDKEEFEEDDINFLTTVNEMLEKL